MAPQQPSQLQKQLPSSSSISTRENSDNGHDDADNVGSDEDQKLELVKQHTHLAPQYTRSRAALLSMALVVAGWLWSRYMRRVARQTAKWGSDRLAMKIASAVLSAAAALGIQTSSQLKTSASERKAQFERQSVMCFHPHGCYVLAAIVNLVREPRNQNSPFYGTFIGIADVLLSIPGVREFGLLLNARSADPNTINSLLASGKTVCICPGGIQEQMATDPEHEQVFFPPNLGFVRQALNHGLPITPIYTFGENQLFDVPAWSRGVTRTIKRWTGAGLPLGIGRWGLPFLPKATSTRTVIGFNVEVGPCDNDPSDAKVREVFLRYCCELRRLFNEHKYACLPHDVAQRDLTLIWRGHEHEDLSASGLAVSRTAGEQRSDEFAVMALPQPSHALGGADLHASSGQAAALSRSKL